VLFLIGVAAASSIGCAGITDGARCSMDEGAADSIARVTRDSMAGCDAGVLVDEL